MCRVAIAEDHHLFREGIILSLQPFPHIQFIAEAENGLDLIHKLTVIPAPDVVLMDIRMPVMDGIEATAWLRIHYPQIKVIGLSMFDDQAYNAKMMLSGASACLPKNAEPAAISKCITDLMAHTPGLR